MDEIWKFWYLQGWSLMGEGVQEAEYNVMEVIERMKVQGEVKIFAWNRSGSCWRKVKLSWLTRGKTPEIKSCNREILRDQSFRQHIFLTLLVVYSTEGKIIFLKYRNNPYVQWKIPFSSVRFPLRWLVNMIAICVEKMCSKLQRLRAISIFVDFPFLFFHNKQENSSKSIY